jgi:hypothetical protein
MAVDPELRPAEAADMSEGLHMIVAIVEECFDQILDR